MTGITLGKAFPSPKPAKNMPSSRYPFCGDTPQRPGLDWWRCAHLFVCSRQGVQFRQTPSPSCASRGQLIPREAFAGAFPPSAGGCSRRGKSKPNLFLIVAPAQRRRSHKEKRKEI
jgi:hypothetical protein